MIKKVFQNYSPDDFSYGTVAAVSTNAAGRSKAYGHDLAWRPSCNRAGPISQEIFQYRIAPPDKSFRGFLRASPSFRLLYPFLQ